MTWKRSLNKTPLNTTLKHDNNANNQLPNQLSNTIFLRNSPNIYPLVPEFLTIFHPPTFSISLNSSPVVVYSANQTLLSHSSGLSRTHSNTQTFTFVKNQRIKNYQQGTTHQQWCPQNPNSPHLITQNTTPQRSSLKKDFDQTCL